ncbi:hypothetical protein B484DRAFT_403781, partial [Ochromonadaceae sp. CCMP2298]
GQAGDGESAIHDASAGIDGLVQGGRGQVQGQGGLDLQEGDEEHGDAPKKRKFADEGGDGGLKAMTVYQQALELLKPGNQGAQGTMHRPDPLQEAAEAAESARAAQEAVLEKGRGLLSKLGWAEGRALGRGARPGIGAPAPAPRKAKAYEKMLSRYQQQR